MNLISPGKFLDVGEFYLKQGAKLKRQING
ncbi:hypothetical protein FHW71_001892 [Enterobacter sp. Sphag1F]|jgi:hypothetical protein|nr:hypothetical protein [Enterobacter sp. Sphag1F]NYI14184.1 hypothetical protein [Enterobacter sp. Sphag71]